jgi:DNA-binding CsgD family transcriptional regulator
VSERTAEFAAVSCVSKKSHRRPRPQGKSRQLQSRTRAGVLARAAAPPSGIGFVLLADRGDVLYRDREAVRVLCYPRIAPDDRELDRAVRDKIRSLVVAASPTPSQPEWFLQFFSGRRRYRCRGIRVELNDAAHTILLIEGAVPESLALSAVCDAHHLTPRERETVSLLMHGFTNRQIATRMGVSVNTVRAFIRVVMVKVGASTRTGIIGALVAR